MGTIWLLLLTGCHRELETVKEENVGLPTFSFEIASDHAIAGESLGYQAMLTWSDGHAERVFADLNSDIEGQLRSEGETLTATLSGDHTITGSVLYGETTFEDTAPLSVRATDPARLDLSLNLAQTNAGDPLQLSIAAYDRYGNSASTEGVSYSVSDPAVVVVPPGVTATIPGFYLLTATLGSLTDSEPFRVVQGPAVDVELGLSDTDLEIYETAVAQVRAWDAYDNLIDNDPTLTVSGGNYNIVGDAITFNEEGWYSVTAEVDGVTDTVGPFLIDSTGPVLTIDPPERGSFNPETPSAVAGTAIDDWSPIDQVTVNGQTVAVDGNGAFATTVDWNFGTNILQTTASDTDRNLTTDTRAVMAGDYLSYGSGLGDGIDARINEAGFDTLESLGEGLISDVDLTALVPSPAYNTSSESCFLGICITWYSITLYVENPVISGVDLELDPDAGGWINTTFTVLNPSIDWRAEGSVTGIGLSGAGTIYADAIAIDMDLTPSVSNGQLQLAVSNVDAIATGFVFDWDSWIYDVMSFFGLDLSGLLQGYLESALESAVTDMVPDAVAGALGDLEIAFDIPLMDNNYHLEAIPWRADVDDTGMTIGLETYFEAEQWLHADAGPGSLYGAYTLPSYSGHTSAMEIGLSLDFLNQALYALWGGGVLDQQLVGADMGLDLGEIGALLGFGDLNIVTRPLLPPTIVPGTGEGLLDLQLGDLELTLYNGPIDPANIAMQIYISAIVPMDLSVTADGLLSPSLGDIDLYFDTVVPANNTLGSADTEALLQGLLPALLPGLLSGLGAIPIPELQGFTLDIDSFSLEGPEQGYFNIAGNLSTQ